MAEDADAAALAALSADVAARPQSTLQSLAVLWDELGYDAHERLLRAQALSGGLTMLCDNVLRAALGERDTLGAAVRELGGRLARLHRLLGRAPPSSDGALRGLRAEKARLAGLVADLELVKEQRIEQMHNLRARACAQLYGAPPLLAREIDEAVALLTACAADVRAILALVHVDSDAYSTELLIPPVQRCRNAVQRVPALTWSDAEATSWAAALSQLVACAVAEVRAVQSQTKAPSDDSVAPKLAFFEAESEKLRQLLERARNVPASIVDSRDDITEAALEELQSELLALEGGGGAGVEEVGVKIDRKSSKPEINGSASTKTTNDQSAVTGDHESSPHSESEDGEITPTTSVVGNAQEDRKEPEKKRRAPKPLPLPSSSISPKMQRREAAADPGDPFADVVLGKHMHQTPRRLVPADEDPFAVPPLSTKDARTDKNTEGSEVASILAEVSSLLSSVRRDNPVTAESADAGPDGAVERAATHEGDGQMWSPRAQPSLSARQAKPLPSTRALAGSNRTQPSRMTLFTRGNKSMKQLSALVLGAPGVGRAALVRRFATDTFREGDVPRNYLTRVDVEGGKRCVNLWCPEEPFKSHLLDLVQADEDVLPVNALILVYNVHSLESFSQLSAWIGAQPTDLPLQHCPILLLGNCADDPVEACEARELAAAWCTAANARHILVSARTGRNVYTVWNALLAELNHARSPQLPPVLHDSQNLFAVAPLVEEPETPALVVHEDIYGTRFYGHVHLVFVGAHKTKTDDHVVVAVRKDEVDGAFPAVLISKKDQKELAIRLSALHAGTSKTQSRPVIRKKLTQFLGNTLLGEEEGFSIAVLVEEHLQREYPDRLFYEVKNAKFTQDLRDIELLHPQRQSSFKLAALYCTGAERSMQDVFAHTDAPPVFFELLDALAHRISLKGWKKYRGDIGADVEGDSYYTQWRGIDIMFHVCLWMNAEQHRRLIGNDVVVLVFHDGDGAFDPAPLNALGTVPQIFGVVRRHSVTSSDATHYRVEFFSRPNIKPYAPHLAMDQVFTAAELKEFLFTKFYNGYCQALSCPPMNRLHEVPRGAAIEELVKRFPQESSQEVKKRLKGESVLKQMIEQARIRDPLLLIITVGKSLPPLSLKEIKDACILVSVGDQEQRTKVIKRASHPEWNETLVLYVYAPVEDAPYSHSNVLGIDAALATLTVTYRSRDKIIAQREISFGDVCATLKQDKWIELAVPNTMHSSPSLTATHSTGEVGAVSLRFDLAGPGAVLCPLCGLYLGSSATVLYQDRQYHERCIACERCQKPLRQAGSSSSDLKVHEGHFYCGRCYAKEGFGEVEHDDDDEEDALVRRGTLLDGLGQNDSPHAWEPASLATLTACGFCGDTIGSLSSKREGFQCSACQYPCHKQCRDLIPGNCSKDPKAQVYHASPGSGLKRVTKVALRKSLRAHSSKTLKK